ncbi:MAG: His/Gly/Thr/Pro-type tRNA ligase C-terminal domain-containing protein [Candidatus Korarchaeum sp.]|nr:His/Gly/Thr/Pro-type tRNA ligase C-terminal domain-containing protein [Candidatus Korarchaeum sp.]MDW8035876.1 His/Gly/Thr/Pro-type tRNA ligase C-terminal domain-containing protein [Candidatus Korarchaeum sp.]
MDYQTLEEDTVTLRDRDTMKQVRVERKELVEKIKKYINSNISIEEL